MIELILVILAILVVLFFAIYYPFFSPSSQLFGQVFFHKTTREKLAAITFDDGPNEPYTSQILDILKKYNIKATFFPVGENILREKNTLKKISADGHEIGNHSYSHAFFGPIISPSFNNEMTKAQNLIIDITGKTPTLFRPPWFLRNASMLKTAKKIGLITITGTFASTWEVFKISSKKIARDAIKHTHPGTILVFHDGYNNKKDSRAQTVKALELTIIGLQKLGYKFVTTTELLEMN